jgi:uncharacterized repeat protein (TIGR02543 family)
VDIVSADYSNVLGYSVMSGTSMAAPCAAGCMALTLSKNPSLTPADICRILEETAVPLAEGKSNITGYGRVDALAAVNAVPDNILSLASYTIHDEQGNNDQQLNAGESVTMDMDLRCGSNALNNATLSITCASEYITVTNGTIALPNFAAGQTQTVTGFAFTVHDDTPVKRKMTFYADVIVGGVTVGNFAFTIPVMGTDLAYESAIIVNDNNGNGTLEPGETADLRVFLSNEGNLTASSLSVTLSVSSNYLNINDNLVDFGDVAPLEHTYVDFSVTLAAGATNAFPLPCSLTIVDAENQTDVLTFSMFNITTTANQAGAGILAGSGTYGTGTTAMLSATTDDSHTFISWKRGNTVVSYTDCSISVTENANYVASFNAISNVIPVGQAEAWSGWVPSDSYYKYNLSEQIYTVEELGSACEITSVAFFNTRTAMTRNIRVYLKHTNKDVFQSGTDWEAVTAGDLLFEGDVYFAVGQWTTIPFNRAFAYDGNHNVLLVVDDNTGSYIRGLYCRMFHDENRSIFVCSDNTNYNPYNPPSDNGSYADGKSQVLFGIANSNYTVTVSANPTGGGNVTGGGTYQAGQPCTISASANPGYTFVKWTKNGTQVSTNPTYSFTVSANANYVAHFASSSYTIAASANPAAGGSVSGTGTYSHGSSCTLTASANSGYVFANWTENGIVVSTNASYTFTVNGNRTLVANLTFVDGLDESNDKEVSIYPNPVQDKLTVETVEPTDLLEIISITGALVYSQTDCPRKAEIQVGSFANGTYLIRLTTGASVVTRIFVKQ